MDDSPQPPMPRPRQMPSNPEATLITLPKGELEAVFTSFMRAGEAAMRLLAASNPAANPILSNVPAAGNPDPVRASTWASVAAEQVWRPCGYLVT